MFEVVDIEDVAGEQIEPDSWNWMRREQIAPEAMVSMFESICRKWWASDQTADAVVDLCGQAFRLGWESQKAAC